MTTFHGDYGKLAGELEKLAATHLFAPMRTRPAEQIDTLGWQLPIARMLEAGYAFDSSAFTVDGCVFRGLPSGFLPDSQLMRSGLVPDCDSGRHCALFEQVFAVQFFSYAISDALAVCGQFDAETDDGKALLVFEASLFNEANQRGEAASLLIGDSGHIFRYPFLTRPLELSDLILVFVSPAVARFLLDAELVAADKIVVLRSDNYADAEHTITKELHARNLQAAKVNQAGIRPRRGEVMQLPVCHVEQSLDDPDSKASGESS